MRTKSFGLARTIGAIGTLAASLLIVLRPSTAQGFCGFYAGGGGAELFNNATQVALMRSGTRTVLSMQNNYQGPAENFALVVPVPVVLQKDQVRTLPRDLFSRVDKLSAPRVVEYWEMDPCAPQIEDEMMVVPSSAPLGRMVKEDKDEGFGVKIEAQFAVGEYQIVILSASEATGLEGWLRANKYAIPKGADTYLRPYVQAGSKFFVAKVDISKVTLKDGMAQLSPLRFYYDSEDFSLPIRLGLMNAKDAQDLIVYILAQGQRYELANYTNVTIPTNLDLKAGTLSRFGEFYAALFDATLEKNQGAVVTEYSWDANSCDPCPAPALNYNELATLGADVVGGSGQRGGGWVLTRLHARYTASGVTDDLVFKAAAPIVGGRERRVAGNKLEHGATPARINNFQGRYAIRHEWTGPIECKSPRRGMWGGPPAGVRAQGPKAAQDLAFAPRGNMKLPRAVAQDIPELSIVAAAGTPQRAAKRGTSAVPSGRPHTKVRSCGCSTNSLDPQREAGLIALLFAVFVYATRRKR